MLIVSNITRIFIISLIDFNGMSTHLELFYAKIKEITFIVHSHVVVSQETFFCTWSYQIQIIFKQIYLTNRWDPNRYYYFRSEWVWELWQWRSTSNSPDLQNWSLNIRCNLVSYPRHTFFGISYPSVEDTVSIL